MPPSPNFNEKHPLLFLITFAYLKLLDFCNCCLMLFADIVVFFSVQPVWITFQSYNCSVVAVFAVALAVKPQPTAEELSKLAAILTTLGSGHDGKGLDGGSKLTCISA